MDYTYPALAGGEDLGNLSRAQLARAASIGLETIRFYEKEGLLPAPMRSPSGYRQYSDADLSRLKFIAAAKNLGFTLQEIAELLSIGNHPSVCPDLRQKAQQKITTIESKIRDLKDMLQMLTSLVECCSSENKDGHEEEDDFCTRLISLCEDSQPVNIGAD